MVSMGDDKTSENASRAIYPAESVTTESVLVSSPLLEKLVSTATTLTGVIGKLSNELAETNPSVGDGVRLPKSFLIRALTPREREVLSLMAYGYTNSAIAEKLLLSRKSVENYINRIYHTLNLADDDHLYSRVAAVLYYIYYIMTVHR